MTMVSKTDPFSIESEVRSYCRTMPTVFHRAENAEVWDENGNRYIDFLSSCGSLNYGHNNPILKERLLSYISQNGITTSMDLHTVAKASFLDAFKQIILDKRGMSYKVQFPGPTGTNAVEAALKLARKVTGRSTIVAFSNAFHGMSLGALAATGNQAARSAAGVPLSHVHRLPFENYQGAAVEALQAYEEAVLDPSGGLERPAAFIVETVQGEGGLMVASSRWLRALSQTAKRLGSLLIVDDIQAGCGRTGTFFSFEPAGIRPDIVCLSKSISGFGLPMSLVLIAPEFDQWRPGEHNGTFRGNNYAFITAAAALSFWRDPRFAPAIVERSETLQHRLGDIAQSAQLQVRGRGLMQGLAVPSEEVARKIAKRAFDQGLLIERCGPKGNVLKAMPPLTIPIRLLEEGLDILQEAVHEEMDHAPFAMVA